MESTTTLQNPRNGEIDACGEGGNRGDENGKRSAIETAAGMDRVIETLDGETGQREPIARLDRRRSDSMQLEMADHQPLGELSRLTVNLGMESSTHRVCRLDTVKAVVEIECDQTDEIQSPE